MAMSRSSHNAQSSVESQQATSTIPHAVQPVPSKARKRRPAKIPVKPHPSVDVPQSMVASSSKLPPLQTSWTNTEHHLEAVEYASGYKPSPQVAETPAESETSSQRIINTIGDPMSFSVPRMDKGKRAKDNESNYTHNPPDTHNGPQPVVSTGFRVIAHASTVDKARQRVGYDADLVHDVMNAGGGNEQLRAREDEVGSGIINMNEDPMAFSVFRTDKGKQRARDDENDLLEISSVSFLREAEQQQLRYDAYLLHDTMDTEGQNGQPNASTSTPSGNRSKGKKRLREDEGESTEQPKKKRGRPKKIIDSDASAKKISIKKRPDAKSTSKLTSTSKANDKNLLASSSVKWRAMELPAQQSASPESLDVRSIKPTMLRPRIWTNNKKELLAMMPEMTGSTCINGVSWKLYQTPMVLLDEHNLCFQVDRTGKDPLSLDLVTTRAFTCPLPNEVEIAKSTTYVNVSPPRPFEEPTVSKGQPVEQAAKPKRRAPRYKSPKPNNRAINAGSKTARLVPAISDEVPTITVTTQPIPPDGSFPPEHLAFPSVSAMQPMKMKLEPNPASALSTAALVPPEKISETDAIRPSTSSRHYVLPVLPDRPLTPADSGLIDVYLTTALNVATHWEFEPEAETSDMDISDTDEELPGFADTLVVLVPSESMGWNTSYQLVHSPSPGADIGNSHFVPPDPSSARQTWIFPEQEMQFKAAYPSIPDFAGETQKSIKREDIASQKDFELTWEQRGARQNSSRDVPAAGHAILKPGLASPLTQQQDTNIGLADYRAKLHPIMGDENLGDMVLLNSENPMDITAATSVPTAVNVAVVDPKTSFSDYIPSSIPEELEAIIDSYVFGRPLTILVSNAQLNDHWSLKLPNEYGYAMLGFFRILGVQETRLPAADMLADSAKKQSTDSLHGQVQWRFHLKWAPGGEVDILPDCTDINNFEHPWWDPPPPSLPPVGWTDLLANTPPADDTEHVKVQDEPEDALPTTPRYRAARLAHHEYQFRHEALGDVYHSVVPVHLLIPFGKKYLDSSFPRGWLCAACGRMNFQAALRHRSCASSFCKDKPPPVAPYAQELFLLRDPQEQLPLSAPLNTYPESLTMPSAESFECGIQTFGYSLKEDDGVFMKHIFTSNAPPLQDAASSLLWDIQLNVPLRRPLAENNPYFFWAAKSPKDNASATDTDWKNIPLCMNEAKKFLISRVQSFAGLKDDQFSVNRLKIQGWITTGSKKSTDPIHAKTKSVVFCALGCTVVLIITPRSMKGSPVADPSQDAESSQLPETDIAETQEDTVALNSGWIAELPDADAVVETSMGSPKKGKTAAKAAKPSFSFMLMHGDILVLYGDDFEYTVKRDGTSLLLIASHDSAERG